MDLSTLDTLLKSHVSQLESLYEELGAPPESVPAKLQELHNALVGTVQQQRQTAEDEVRQVKECILALEATIVRKRCQLSGESSGPEATTTSTSTTSTSRTGSETLLQQKARLEKQDVALERDIQIREKQISEVLRQLDSYRPILGDFLDTDGDGGNSSATDLSLTRLSRLQQKVSQCKEEVTRREQIFQSLLQDILELWNELGLSPSEQQSGSSEYAAMSHPTGLQLDLAILRTTQQLAIDRKTPHAGNSTGTPLLKPDSTTIASLSARKAALENEREQRMLKIQDLYDQLFPLWTRLGVSDEEADEFVEVWKGCERRCIEAYEAELARMLQVKADNMAIFIQREREDIVSLWDALYYADEERARFHVIASEIYNEEVLLAHEMEKQKLLKEKLSKESILTKLARYFGLLDEMRQLEESANDPSRLTGRGQRGDPGRLLREEKQRKRVAKEKPKLESDLMRSIPEWEEQHGQAFMVSGSRLLEDLSAKVESEQLTRPPSRRARTPAPPPPTTSKAAPSTQSVKRTMQPQAPASSVTQSVASSKRQRLGASTASSSSSSQPARAIARVAGLGGIPATPCPSQPLSNLGRSGNLMLVASELRPTNATQLQVNTAGQSRLPLKTTVSSYQATQSTAWHSVGVGAGKSALGNQSLFSPPGQAVSQHHQHKAAFRPRPSIASTGTNYSSAPPSSIFSGRCSRIASVATTASYGSDEPC